MLVVTSAGVTRLFAAGRRTDASSAEREVFRLMEADGVGAVCQVLGGGAGAAVAEV